MRPNTGLNPASLDDGFDLDESTCTPETLDLIMTPDSEADMPFEKRIVLNDERVKNGFYTPLKAKRLTQIDTEA